jgi:WD40 repeat protein
MALALLLAGCDQPAARPTQWGPNHTFRATRRAVISSPLVYDVTGDGALEIAIGSWDGYFYLLDAQLDDLPGWPKWSRKGFFASAALADLDGDGLPELIVGAETGKLHAWKGDGSSASGFPVNLGYHIWASVAVLDGPTLALGGRDAMHLLDRQGQPVPGWPRPMEGWPDATAASDGRLIAITTLVPGDVSMGRLYVWTVAGELLSGFPLTQPQDSDSAPAIVDLDGDGQPWFIFGDDAGYLYVVDASGQARPGFPTRSEGPAPGRPTPTPHPPGGNIHSIEASPAVADLTGDGRCEIVVGSWDGQLYVWDDAGQPLPGWPKRVGDQIISSAALVDITGDDRPDIIVGSKDGFLYGWTSEGQIAPGFPYDLKAPVFSSPWVGDLDGDGRADVVVGANNGIHLLRNVGPLGRAPWPMFHADAQRTGAAACGR